MKRVILGLVFLGLSVGAIWGVEIEEKVNVRVIVGKYRLVIMGYTSAGAEVELTMGERVNETTIANEEGVFIFYNVFMPEVPSEPCLVATDISGVTSAPICLSVPSAKDTTIVDVYMPPTLAVSLGKIEEGKTEAAYGMTTPDSEVEVYLFNEEKQSIIKGVFAKEGPKLKIESDQVGKFEFNMPTNQATKYRLFVGSRFDDFISPKSNTLSYKVLAKISLIIIILLVLALVLSIIAYLVIREKRKPLPCIGD